MKTGLHLAAKQNDHLSFLSGDIGWQINQNISALYPAIPKLNILYMYYFGEAASPLKLAGSRLHIE